MTNYNYATICELLVCGDPHGDSHPCFWPLHKAAGQNHALGLTDPRTHHCRMDIASVGQGKDTFNQSYQNGVQNLTKVQDNAGQAKRGGRVGKEKSFTAVFVKLCRLQWQRP